MQEGLQKWLDTEIGQSRAEENRRQLARSHGLHIKFIAGAVQQFDVVPKGGEKIFTQQGQKRIVIHIGFVGGHLVLPIVGIKSDQAVLLPVVHPLEFFAAAHGPVHGIGTDSQLVFNLLQQLVGIAGLPVHFIDKGKNRDMPHGAYLEQLPGLGFDTLTSVDNHHRRVSGHQSAIGVLREILVAGGIQNIDAVPLILELHHRRSDRNTALLFDLHPVRNRVAGIFLSLYGAGQIDGPAIEQEFFGQRGFTGIRVRNNRKRASFFNFTAKICQGEIPPVCSFRVLFLMLHEPFYFIIPFKKKPQIFTRKARNLKSSAFMRGRAAAAFSVRFPKERRTENRIRML